MPDDLQTDRLRPRRIPAASAGGPAPGRRRSPQPGSGAPSSGPRRTSRSRTSTRRPTWRASTRSATWAGPASSPSPGASSPRCTGAASGRCASTPASRRPPRRTSASATSSSRARRACRSPSTCPPRWATTRDAPEAEGEVGRVGVPICSLADMEVLFDRHPARRREHVDDHQRHRGRPARPLRGRGREAGRGARADLRHDPERHPQGVHRPRHLHLPAAAVDAPRDRRLRVLRARAAALEHDQHQRLPHARGRGDRGPGAGLHAGRRHRLRRGGGGPRARRRRLRRPALVLLRRLERALRGGRQVPGGPPPVGPDREGALRGDRPALDDLPVPRPDRRLVAHRPVDRQQRGPDDGPGAGGRPRRGPEPAHELRATRRSPCRPRRPPGWRSGRSRSWPTNPGSPRRPTRSPAATTWRPSRTSSRCGRGASSTRSTRWAGRSRRSRAASSSARSRSRPTASSGPSRAGDQVVVGVNAFRDEEAHTPPTLRIDPDGERRQVESVRRVRAERDSDGLAPLRSAAWKPPPGAGRTSCPRSSRPRRPMRPWARSRTSCAPSGVSTASW